MFKLIRLFLIITIFLAMTYSCTDSPLDGNDDDGGTTTPEATDGDESTEKPVIFEFLFSEGSMTDDGEIGIMILSEGAVPAAWLITGTADQPSADSADWLTSEPDSYTLSAFGTYDLYAWIKNSAGTVSDSSGPLTAEYVNGPEAGEIIITEYMADPSEISDTEGEWFEIYNTSSETRNLKGCIFSDEGGNNFTVSDELLIPPSSFLTLAVSDSPGFTPDYVYSGFTLTNMPSSDEIIITSVSGVLIDEIDYADSLTAGASRYLFSADFNSVDNDSPVKWEDSTSVYNISDKGTPGSANDG